MADILSKIIDAKRLEVARQKAERPLDSFLAELKPSERDFLKALQQPGPRFILECKKASPSKGLIRPNFDLSELSAVYGRYADCISVLTDSEFFQGSYHNLSQMRALVDQPLLHKDFIIDPYQVYLGRRHGADAVLLMLSVLNDDEYQALHQVADALAMTVLTEVSTVEETQRAVALGARLIGINNRNLRDLSTDLTTSVTLRGFIPPETTVVSESGIYTNQQVRQLSEVADAFLVGSSLMAQADLALACKRLTRGEHKVCGLTRPEDVLAVAEAGACYAGLIFYPKSPRAVSLEQAQHLVAAAQAQAAASLHSTGALQFVGVFVDAAPHEVASTAQELGLSAVQLHGQENDAYIDQLKPLLPAGTEIWRAYRVGDSLPNFTSKADRLLLDTYQAGTAGGTGQTFNWQLLQPLDTRVPVMLAGGLNPDNVVAALKLPVAGLDINSGIEQVPGIKDQHKLTITFNRIREFSYDKA
ncbi:MAG: bifunctional indole-3-glycerol-phosphate synthase TrpC/phosphoribosylanthranilate isomerase TrpF [Alkalimonas sp.]|nr:bifunctional indole-3-glycerol-phosphate synthase TrpC/phosphoribosylanthranilate isomerase TrpF [Alkalimonas sp.]